MQLRHLTKSTNWRFTILRCRDFCTNNGIHKFRSQKDWGRRWVFISIIQLQRCLKSSPWLCLGLLMFIFIIHRIVLTRLPNIINLIKPYFINENHYFLSLTSELWEHLGNITSDTKSLYLTSEYCGKYNRFPWIVINNHNEADWLMKKQNSYASNFTNPASWCWRTAKCTTN